MTVIRIATRGSDLALVQARDVAGMLQRALRVESELVVVKTTGDRIQHTSLAKLGGKGLFVKEIEEALLEGRADVAVHSAKDLPAAQAEGLALVAFPERVDCRDALVANERGITLDTLRKGARVGTGSARREALLRRRRPDVEVVPLRGNVPTRLRKLDDERLDAVILACAGLDRLGLADRIDERISPETLLPAVAQGALALEARCDDALAAELAALDDAEAAVCIAAERGFLLGVGGDCTTPLAALAEPLGAGRLRLRALVASRDGSRVVTGEELVDASQPADGGSRLAGRLLAAGGTEILAEDAARADDGASA